MLSTFSCVPIVVWLHLFHGSISGHCNLMKQSLPGYSWNQSLHPDSPAYLLGGQGPSAPFPSGIMQRWGLLALGVTSNLRLVPSLYALCLNATQCAQGRAGKIFLESQSATDPHLGGISTPPGRLLGSWEQNCIDWELEFPYNALGQQLWLNE